MTQKSYVNLLFVVVASLLLTSGLAFKGYQWWYANLSYIKNSKQFLISGIYQTGPQKEAISTNQIAELIGLSVDHPTHIYDFDPKDAEKKLLSYPLFKTAKVTKKKPSHLLVDYSIRTPYVIVKDYPDAVMDEEGVIFPYRQFFSQKIIPECFLGLSDESFVEEKKKLSIDVLKKASQILQSWSFSISLVDVSSAFVDSYSKREIILSIQQVVDGISFPYYLRLNVLEIEKQLSNFLVLCKELSKQQKLFIKLNSQKIPKPKVIDLRLEGMALID
jgi:cell division septal protein FtsQ